jgi:hypothetical protein
METLCCTIAMLNPFFWNTTIWTLIALLIMVGFSIIFFTAKSSERWKLKYKLLEEIMSGAQGSLNTIPYLRNMPLKIVNDPVFSDYIYRYFSKIVKTWNVFHVSRYISLLLATNQHRLINLFFQAMESSGQDRLTSFYIEIIVEECKGPHGSHVEIKELIVKIMRGSNKAMGQYLNELEAGIEALLQDEKINDDTKDLIKAEMVKFRRQFAASRSTSIPLNDN